MTSAIIDLGGGLGVPYRGTNDVPPHPDEYARMVKAARSAISAAASSSSPGA